MAAVAVTVAITDQWSDGKRLHVVGTIKLDNGNYADPGFPLSFAGTIVQSSGKPKMVKVTGRAFPAVYNYTPGAARDDGTVNIVEHSAGGGSNFTELANGAVPAGIAADTLDFYAVFDALV